MPRGVRNSSSAPEVVRAVAFSPRREAPHPVVATARRSNLSNPVLGRKGGELPTDFHSSRPSDNRAAVAEGGTWLESRLLYEIGQKTLSDAKFLQYSKILDPIERGRALVANDGWIKAILPEGNGWFLGIEKTFKTGPTPGGWLGLGGLGAGGLGYYLWYQSNNANQTRK